MVVVVHASAFWAKSGFVFAHVVLNRSEFRYWFRASSSCQWLKVKKMLVVVMSVSSSRWWQPGDAFIFCWVALNNWMNSWVLWGWKWSFTMRIIIYKIEL